MKKFAFLILSFAFFYSLTAEATVGGLVRVDANVHDEALGHTVKRTGTGTLLERNGRYFVLTAAHVSVASEAELTVDGEKLSVIKRRANAANDIEWIEVAKPTQAKPLASWDNSCHCFAVSDADAEQMGPVGSDARMPRMPWIDNSGRRTRFRAGVRADIDGTPDFRTRSERFTGRQILSSRMRPGESGAPLFRKENGKWVLSGVAQSFDRNFLVSYFSAPYHFQQEILEFDEPQTSDAIRWRLRNGVTYLDFGNGIREIVPADPRASKVGVTDDGSKVGVTDDGSKVGVTDDGSKVGVTDDGSSGNRGLRVLPGIELDGNPYIGVRLQDGSFAYADRSAIELLRVLVLAGESGRSGHLATGSKLQALLLERLKKITGREIGPGSVIESPGRGVLGAARVEILEKGIVLYLPIGMQEEGKPRLLRVELDEFGRYQGNAFQPLIRVKNPEGGKDYIVDLRGFYFVHLAWTNETQQGIPVARVRKEGAAAERYYGFTRLQGEDKQDIREHCLPQIETLDADSRKFVEDFLSSSGH